MYINENKTLKELRERGFYINAYSLYYDVNSICRIVFDMNCRSDDYLKYIGREYSALVEINKNEKEIKTILKELEETGFIERRKRR